MRRSVTLMAVLGMVPILLAQEVKQEAKPSEEEKAAMKKLQEAKNQGATTSAPAASQPAGTKPAAGGLTVRVRLDTTLGPIALELDGDKAPISVQNFVAYVEAKFYDGLIFHRVMKDFMIQGGGYTPELAEKKEGLQPPIHNEWKNGLKNARGTIAMARTQVADSATAQFFINVVDNAMLDTPRDGAAYAVFGKVVEGMETVDRIRNTEVTTNPRLPMGPVVPKEAVVIKSAKVVGEYDKKALAEKAAAAEKAPAKP
jgi:cyclophilin family peptidyl-prolyl cis-trans isomerase